MRKISTRSAQLHWTQPGTFRRAYELHSGPEQVGRLEIPGMLGTLATAESSDGTWTFKRTGWCGSRATIRASGQSVNLAEFRKSGWSCDGELTFADGRKFKAGPNFWMTRFEIRTESDQPVIRILNRGFLHASGDVEILGGQIPELPILVMFGWYLFVLQKQDGAAVAAVG